MPTNSFNKVKRTEPSAQADEQRLAGDEAAYRLVAQLPQQRIAGAGRSIAVRPDIIVENDPAARAHMLAPQRDIQSRRRRVVISVCVQQRNGAVCLTSAPMGQIEVIA